MKKLLYIGNKLSTHGSSPTTLETLGPLLENEGFIVHYSSSKRNKFIRIMEMLFSIVKFRKSDYVLIDTYSTANFWYAFATSQLCRLFKLKYIPLLHGGNLPSRFKNNPIICNLIFNNAYCNVSPSLYLSAEFKKQGFSVIYIPNTIELKKYPFLSRKIESPKLLWVRAFAEIYNPLMAVSVLFHLQKKYPNATLCMVGSDKDGSLTKVKKQAAQLGVTINFTGKLTKSEWLLLSQDYNIFINTTHFDNMPVSIIEVMGLGLAVVSTNVGGIPYLLEHEKNALLVADNCADEMVTEIEKLVKNPSLYNQLTLQAQINVKDFDWEIVKKIWLNFLQ